MAPAGNDHAGAAIDRCQHADITFRQLAFGSVLRLRVERGWLHQRDGHARRQAGGQRAERARLEPGCQPTRDPTRARQRAWCAGLAWGQARRNRFPDPGRWSVGAQGRCQRRQLLFPERHACPQCRIVAHQVAQARARAAMQRAEHVLRSQSFAQFGSLVVQDAGPISVAPPRLARPATHETGLDVRAGAAGGVPGGLMLAYQKSPARHTARRAALVFALRASRTNTGPGPRTARRPRDFWYPSMSAGAAPSSGHAQCRRLRGGFHFSAPDTASVVRVRAAPTP